jgi:hypothetical protein
MYNNDEYEKYLQNEKKLKPTDKSITKRPTSRHNKLPPVPTPTATNFEKYLAQGGYLEKNIQKNN